MNFLSIARRAFKAIHQLPLTVLVVSTSLFFLPSAALAGPNASPYKLCFPQVIGLPQSNGSGGFTFPRNAPIIVGAVPSDDTGWTNAFRYIFQNGSNSPLGAVQANQQNSTIYFQFQVSGDHDFDQWDGIVLGFDNTNAADPHRYTYIYISAFGVLGSGVGATSGVALPANQVLYWQSQDGSTWTEGNPGPSWITASASSAGAQSATSSNLAWNVLVSISNAGQSVGGPGLPTGVGSAFGFYMDAIRVWSTGGPDTQFTWPPNVDLVNDLNPSAGIPSTSSWGNATLDTSQTCSGVYFTSSDISNSITGGSSQTTEISWTQANTFNVNVHNSAVGKPANNVVASFKIADFGLPASQDWQAVGLYPPAPGTGKDDSVPDVNTPPPGVTIPAAVTSASPPGYIPGSQSIKAGPWTLGPSNVAWYKDNSDPNNPHQHQCVLVELDSTNGDTTFVNRSTWNNFEFTASASQFKSPPATVSANYPAIGGQANQTFEIAVAQHEVSPGNGYPLPQTMLRPTTASTSGGEGDGDIHYLDYTVSSCRLTGKSLKMEGPPTVNSDHRITAPGQSKTFKNCDDGGAYGYLIKHQGPANWVSELAASGAGVVMKTLAVNQYELTIPQGQKVQLISTVSSSGSITNGNGSGPGNMWPWWWRLVILLFILILLLLLFRRRKHA